MNSARRVFYKLRQLAPYALIEILLPGGTLLALGLWLYRRRKDRRPTSGRIEELLPHCWQSTVNINEAHPVIACQQLGGSARWLSS